MRYVLAILCSTLALCACAMAADPALTQPTPEQIREISDMAIQSWDAHGARAKEAAQELVKARAMRVRKYAVGANQLKEQKLEASHKEYKISIAISGQRGSKDKQTAIAAGELPTLPALFSTDPSGKFQVIRAGRIGPIGGVSTRVLQVIDDGRLLITAEADGDSTIALVGMPTEDLTDGLTLRISDTRLFLSTGTKGYDTAFGKKTVVVLEELDTAPIRESIIQRVKMRQSKP